MGKKIEATCKWWSYNSRRYGRPWAAHITEFSGTPKLEFIPYCYNGSDAGGELVFTAEIGEVIKYGQKDNRGNGTVNLFAIVNEDGTLSDIKDPVEARQKWNEWKQGK